MNEYRTDMQRMVAVMAAADCEVTSIQARYDGDAPSYQAGVDGKTEGWYYGYESFEVTFVDHNQEPIGPNGLEAVGVYVTGNLIGYNLALWETIGWHGTVEDAAAFHEANPIPAELNDAVLLYSNRWADARWGFEAV